MNKGFNSAYIMFEQLFWKYFRYARMTSLKFSNSYFSVAISNIYAQFVPVHRTLNSACIILQQLFRKYFRYARMTSLKISKFDCSAAISNIYSQFLPLNRGLYCAYFMLNKFFESTSGLCEWRHYKFHSLFFPLLLAIFMRTLRQWIED